VAAWRLFNAYRREQQLHNAYCGEHTGEMRTTFRPKDGILPSVWRTAAKRLDAAGITNAERYVQAQGRQGKLPTPTSLTTAAAFRMFYHCDKHAVSSLQQSWRSQSGQFESELMKASSYYPHYTEKELLDYVLRTAVELTAMFKYCIAVSERFFAAAAMLHDTAVLEFLADPMGYVEAWPGCVPKSLRDEVSNIIATPL
jgi:hypothetical protein